MSSLNEKDSTVASADLAMVALALRELPSTQYPNLLSRLEDWVQALEPQYSEQDVRQALSGISGTMLEPFCLDTPSLDAAVLLLRVAFSKTCMVTRARLVSQETIGIGGGAVFTSNLKSFYAERYALGANRSHTKSRWFFAPAVMQDILGQSGDAAKNRRATISLQETGIQIAVQWFRGDSDEGGVQRRRFGWKDGKLQSYDVDGSPPSLQQQLQTNSTVLKSGTTLERAGLKLRFSRDNLLIEPGSAEASIRLMALCAQEAVLALDPGEGMSGQRRTMVRLRLPVAGEILPLPTLATISSQVCRQWLVADLPPGIPGPGLTIEEKKALAACFPVPEHWYEHVMEFS